MVESKFRKYFSSIETRPLSLLFMVKRVSRNRRFLAGLYRLDAAILKRAPIMTQFCGESVIVLRGKK